jgi:UDP-N-acetylmuramoylalanine--D-glutamate ligase
MKSFSGSTVVVLGLARSGEAAARALMDAGARVVVADETDGPVQRERAARLGGARVALGRVNEEDFAGASLVVASPGIPPHSALWKAAEASGAPVWSEIELAYRLGVRPAAAITGTNGKTTATEMTVAALTAAGNDAAAAGNIGAPLVDARAATIVAEVSSFQLHAIEEFRAHVAVLMNVAADHLDWHGSFEAYVEDKRRIFDNQTAEDVAIVHASCARLHRGASRPVVFDEGARPAGGAGVEDGWIVVPQGRVCEVGRLRARGRTVRADAVAAAAAACELGAEPRAAGEGLASYELKPHRIEHVADAGGVAYVNDSKATDPHATLAALEDFDDVVLIAGGRNKGLDLSELRAGAPKLRAVIAIGEASAEIADAFAGAVDVERADSVEDAVARAARIARPGDTVLLSPACSSWDMFANYQERGDAFRAAVEVLKGAKR